MRVISLQTKPVVIENQTLLKEKKPEILSPFEKVISISAKAICRVSTKGSIKFCNTEFIENSEFFEKDLINNSIDTIKHPEMPEIISLVIQNNLEQKRSIVAIVKNKTKFGKFFWTVSKYTPNTTDNFQIAYQIESTGISEFAKTEITKLYNKLYKIEQNTDVVTASKYLIGFLEEKGMSYSAYIKQLIEKSL